MVHSLSGIVLHRLHPGSRSSDTPTEANAVIGEMARPAREHDPAFCERIGEETPLSPWREPVHPCLPNTRAGLRPLS